jgi:hypothetical protein
VIVTQLVTQPSYFGGCTPLASLTLNHQTSEVLDLVGSGRIIFASFGHPCLSLRRDHSFALANQLPFGQRTAVGCRDTAKSLSRSTATLPVPWCT